MRLCRGRSLFHSVLALAALLVLAALIGAILWQPHSRVQPAYGGKQLSVWVDELRALGYSKQADRNTAQAQAVRAIGTNAIPWLLSELRKSESQWRWRLNMLLEKQRFITYRFPDARRHGNRAACGFYALGPLAEPAIPDLLSLLETDYDVVPFLLSSMGSPALPALQQCLTNTRAYPTSEGPMTLIPGITIGCIYNDIAAGRIPKREAVIFLPAIRDWAKSTNKYPAVYAAQFLKDLHLSLSADDDRDEISRLWR